jgi:hypothetical protein
MEWEKTGNIIALFDQFNRRFPHRSKRSDGTIGDAAHRGRTSGHNPDLEPGSKPEWRDGDSKNEVRAGDVDKDLFDDRGADMHDVIAHLCRLGRSDPNFPIRYILWNRQEYHQDNNYYPRPYDGDNPHTEHAHFSGKKSQKADNARDYDYRLDTVGKPVTVTAPTPSQNWAHDVNPDPNVSNQAGGTLWTIMGRTGILNTLGARLTAIDNALKDDNTDLNAIGASIAVIASGINALMEDPYGMENGMDHPIIQCLKWYDENKPTA